MGLSKERFRRAVELSWDMIMLIDARARIEYVNAAVERILGFPEHEFVGSGGFSLVHADDLSRAQAMLADLIDNPGRPMITEMRLHHRDGTWRWVDIVARNLLHDPDVGAIVVNARDITELTRQRQALDQANQEAQVFRRMIELASQAIGTADLETRILYQNPQMLRLLGLPSLEAARRHSYEDFYREEDLRFLRQVVMPEVLSKGHWTGEMMLQPLSGKPLATIHSIYLLRDAAGRDWAVSNLVTDITQQKRVEQSLRASEGKFRQLFEGSLDGIALTDVDSGLLIDCNEALCRISGRDRAGLIGKPMQILHLAQTGREPMYAGTEVQDSTAGTSVRDAQLVTATGQLRDVEISANVLELDGRKVVQSILRDVTQRKQAEAALERRILALTRPLDAGDGIAFEDLLDVADIQRLQDLIAKAFGVASLITKPDGTPITRPSNFTDLCANIIRATPTGLQQCQRSDAVVGRHNPSGPNVQTCLSAGLCNAGASITVGGHHVANWLIGQVRNESHDERTILRYAGEIGADADAFRSAYQRVPAMSQEQFDNVAQILFAVAHQISTSAYQNVQQARFIAERDQAEARRKELEMALRQRQRDLERFARLDLLNSIASGLAHELNQPIAAAQYLLSGCLRIVRSTSLSKEDMTQILTDVYGQIERVGKIIEQISGLSRRRRSKASRLDMQALLKEAMAFLDFEFRRGQIATSCEVQDGLPAVLADRVRVQQSVLILLQNAVESIRSRGSGRVSLGAAAVAGAVEVRVCDDGPGFSEEALQHLFLPFFTTKEGGMGLGLAICRSIVEEYGGQLIVENNPDHGATVRFTLPVR